MLGPQSGGGKDTGNDLGADVVAHCGHDQFVDDGSARLQVASEAQDRIETADRCVQISSIHGSPRLEGGDTRDLPSHLDVGEQCRGAQTGFEHAPIDALCRDKLAKTHVVQLDHLVDRRRGHGLRLLCERLGECKITPGPFTGGLATSFGFGARGKTYGHFLTELEQGIEIKRRGVLAGRKNEKELFNIKKRVHIEAFRCRRDGARQSRIRALRSGFAAAPSAILPAYRRCRHQEDRQLTTQRGSCLIGPDANRMLYNFVPSKTNSAHPGRVFVTN